MDTAPKAIRPHIVIAGRTNVGKSTFLNWVAGQDVAITSPVPGTTTDVVEKSMELAPVGPVVFLDTGGLDDASTLGSARVARTRKALDRADICVLLTESGVWTPVEEAVWQDAQRRQVPVVLVVNKTDLRPCGAEWLAELRRKTPYLLALSCTEAAGRAARLETFRQMLAQALQASGAGHLPLVADLVPAGGLVVLVVPIDLQAPKGRLILPQVQTIRDALDNDAAVLVVKEREYAALLTRLRTPPDLVVCDSQVVLKVVADTPATVRCTTFSILFARWKGDLVAAAEGAAALEGLRPGDRVLIAEACSHHALADDIGRVKIPRWLRQYAGADLTVDVCAGRDYPADLARYRAVVHCGSCMLTRREMCVRLAQGREAGVPVTNYGLAISMVQGVLRRVLSPFPAALEAWEAALAKEPAGAQGKEPI
jgi:[FeFe] hydrogenase H-cluster maturation GTPase HydF